MSTIPDHLSNEIAEATLREIERTFGYVPALFRGYAVHPPLLKANWDKVKSVLLGGTLPRKTKEIIALLVSHHNGCAYCVSAHSRMLKTMGMSDRDISALLRDIEDSGLNDSDKALVRFAMKTNQDWKAVSRSDHESLRSSGFTDIQIVEAIGIVELFSSFNKFIAAMGIEEDA